MASLLRLRMRLSTALAVAIVVVTSSLAPAFAARALQDTSTLVTTPTPAETQRPSSLVFGTVAPSQTWPSAFACTEDLACVECTGPANTGYTLTLTTTGRICTKTYPVDQADGKLPDGPNGTFTGLPKTDSFALCHDLYERCPGYVVGACFSSTMEILYFNNYHKFSDSMLVVLERSNQMLTRLPEIRNWFDSNFKDKKPTVQIFDVSLDWVPSEGQSQTMVGVYFIIRAETDTQVVTFNAYWASPLPVTVLNKWPQGWTLNRVFNVKVVAKS